MAYVTGMDGIMRCVRREAVHPFIDNGADLWRSPRIPTRFRRVSLPFMGD